MILPSGTKPQETMSYVGKHPTDRILLVLNVTIIVAIIKVVTVNKLETQRMNQMIAAAASWDMTIIPLSGQNALIDSSRKNMYPKSGINV